MRLSPEPPAAGAKRELTDADRARIDARMARFGVAQEFAQAGLIVGEDYRKVTQLYEQLSAQAGSRGEALPAMDVWLQQRAQERLAQGYLPTLPDGRGVQPFEAAMNEAAGLAAGGRGAAAADWPERSMSAAAEVSTDPVRGPAAVEGLLGQLALGQRGRVDGNRGVAAPAVTTPDTAASTLADVGQTAAQDDAGAGMIARADRQPARVADPLQATGPGEADKSNHRSAVDTVLDQLVRDRRDGRQG